MSLEVVSAGKYVSSSGKYSWELKTLVPAVPTVPGAPLASVSKIHIKAGAAFRRRVGRTKRIVRFLATPARDPCSRIDEAIALGFVAWVGGKDSWSRSDFIALGILATGLVAAVPPVLALTSGGGTSKPVTTSSTLRTPTLARTGHTQVTVPPHQAVEEALNHHFDAIAKGHYAAHRVVLRLGALPRTPMPAHRDGAAYDACWQSYSLSWA